MNKVKVLYIVGWGRSGSTILDNLLGEIDGFFSAGEINYLWKRGLVRGRKCGCALPVADCPVWSSVLERGFGYPQSDEVDPVAVVRWQEAEVQLRHTPGLLRKRAGRPTGSEALDAYLRVTERLFLTTAEVTGARVIVDSSKRPSDAAVLRLLPGVTPYFVHLVRDPRAVTYSWERKKARKDSDRPVDMLTHSPADSTINWVAWNLAAEALRRRSGAGRSILLRYEDFVSEPRATLRSIQEIVEEPANPLPFSDDDSFLLGVNHTVSGNPSRFKSGATKLRRDDEWIERQKVTSRLVTTALALPLLRRYRYPLRPASPPRVFSELEA